MEEKQLIYRGYDGFGGFRSGHPYTLTVGRTDDGSGQLYVLHPATHQPWGLLGEQKFWEVWEKVR